ncbi:MAG: hypothetical protein EOP08_03915 [Proteobacteria bacterium]|nr:MAG: hypothetical protein EOP08_03915 [Pseudomonadota bacterium]
MWLTTSLSGCTSEGGDVTPAASSSGDIRPDAAAPASSSSSSSSSGETDASDLYAQCVVAAGCYAEEQSAPASDSPFCTGPGHTQPAVYRRLPATQYIFSAVSFEHPERCSRVSDDPAGCRQVNTCFLPGLEHMGSTPVDRWVTQTLESTPTSYVDISSTAYDEQNDPKPCLYTTRLTRVADALCDGDGG